MATAAAFCDQISEKNDSATVTGGPWQPLDHSAKNYLKV